MSNANVSDTHPRMPNIAWALHTSIARGFSVYELATMVVLAEMANSKMECWPSIRRLSLCTRCSERTVHRALRSLEDAGLIRIKKRYQKSSIYHVLRDPEGACEAPSRVTDRHQKKNPPKKNPPSPINTSSFGTKDTRARKRVRPMWEEEEA